MSVLDKTSSKLDKVFCVISHTHWDREWYMPFEQFRLRLVDLMDHLLQLLEATPQYIFHLDAQTIVLEDYLDIRPYQKEVLQKYIREGRLLVGPWYVQNDFYLTSGEATIRNLQIGSRMADEMGKCTWVGYTPDQFGLISQLPQIFNGFGMDSCIFGRGYNFFEKAGEELKPVKMPSEFIWKCEDGSEVLAVNMPFWYNNAQRFSEDISKSLKLLEMIESNFEGVALTPYLLLMNGVDHLEAQENLVPIIEKLGQALENGISIVQTSMTEYLDNVKNYLKIQPGREPIPEYKGELRNGVDYQILQGTLSSRIYLKAANVRAQNLLENKLEPVYSFISMVGAGERYPTDFLRYLWKLLIQNHPHDSICGCSRDEIHDHMEDRYERIHEAGEELLQRGLDFISAHIDRNGLVEGDYFITLFNTVEAARDEVVEVELHFPVEEAVAGFRILDSNGKDIPFALISREKKHRDIFSPINLPGSKEVDAFKIQLYVEGLEGMSYKVLTVKPASMGHLQSDDDKGIRPKQPVEPLMTLPLKLPAMLENEHLSALINADGTIDLTYKETGRQYKNILCLEDAEDCGDSYTYGKAMRGRTYTTDGLVPEIKCISNSGYETRYSLTYCMELPECFEKETGLRSEKLVANRIEMIISLRKGSRWLDIDFNIDNASKDHRLRALVNTRMDTDFTYASTPFDVVERDRRDVLKGIKNGTQPNSVFVDIWDGVEGIAVLNQGIHEYEHLLDDKGTVAMTLLRVNGKIEINSRGDTWQVPGNQCLKMISLKMALYPHTGDWRASGVILRSKEFLNPVLSYYQPVDIRKFVGGRPAVQDSAITEIFYREKPYAQIVLPHDLRLFDVKGKDVVVSAVKKCEDGDNIVIRLYNSSSTESEFELTYFKPIKSVMRLNMKEETVTALSYCENRIEPVRMNPKEIYTLSIK